MDNCILEAYLWKCINAMEPFVHAISTSNSKSMLIGNSQLSKTHYEFCLKLLYYMVKGKEQKVFTFKRGLNIGRSTNRLLTIRLQVGQAIYCCMPSIFGHANRKSTEGNIPITCFENTLG